MTQFDKEQISKDRISGDPYYILKAPRSWYARDSRGHGFYIHEPSGEQDCLVLDGLLVSRNMARSLINVLESWLERDNKHDTTSK